MKFLLKNNKGKVGILLTMIVLCATAVELVAGPTIIRDRRVTDLSITPTLGRGYSISTNSYQSQCMGDVNITVPSYDFRFDFHELDSTTKLSSTFGQKNSVGLEIGNWLGAQMSEQTKASVAEKLKYENVVVFIVVDTYYASVDEGKTALSNSAKELLKDKDFPGFFSACGPYYVRGINRTAQYVAIFSRVNVEENEKSSFKAQLQAKITAESITAKADSEVEASQEVDTSMNDLTILVRGWGLGKDASANLIASNIEEFKGVVKGAFKQMQNPLTGRVTSVELVPWAENLSFQANAKIQGKDVVNGQAMPMFRKKDVLTNNSEFMVQAERAARARLNKYYQAKVCKEYLRDSFYVNGKLDPKMGKQPLRNLRMNSNDKVTVKDLDELLKPEKISDIFDEEYLPFLTDMDACFKDLLSYDVDAFLLANDPTAAKRSGAGGDNDNDDDNDDDDDGGSGSGSGSGSDSGDKMGTAYAKARAVKEALESSGRGLWRKRWMSHPKCKELQKSFVPPSQADGGGGIIDDHCLPTLYDGPTKKKGAADGAVIER